MPTVIRFSTVIGGRDSSEVARNQRGFAVKSYKEDVNWDLVGNHRRCSSSGMPSVAGRDPLAQAQPGDVPPGSEPYFDFMSKTPEAQHMLTFLFSPRGIPRSYRHQEGYGVHGFVASEAKRV